MNESQFRAENPGPINSLALPHKLLSKTFRVVFKLFHFVLFFFTKLGFGKCLTVCAAKPGSLWVLDSQLKTEIHSFSESPPSDVSKYHRGPFGQRPQGP